MKKYNTKPIDFTGCHPVIAEHLKRGEAIECRVWDLKGTNRRVGTVVGFSANSAHPYRCYNNGSSIHRYAEPIPIKTRRIMPPERAIPVLIAAGWKFSERGSLRNREAVITPYMFSLFGTCPEEHDHYNWPPCIIEEVEDDDE